MPGRICHVHDVRLKEYTDTWGRCPTKDLEDQRLELGKACSMRHCDGTSHVHLQLANMSVGFASKTP